MVWAIMGCHNKLGIFLRIRRLLIIWHIFQRVLNISIQMHTYQVWMSSICNNKHENWTVSLTGVSAIQPCSGFNSRYSDDILVWFQWINRTFKILLDTFYGLLWWLAMYLVQMVQFKIRTKLVFRGFTLPRELVVPAELPGWQQQTWRRFIEVTRVFIMAFVG